MKILVTGGAGFIGANLCRELLARPMVSQVTILDDFSTGKLSNIDGLPLNVVKESVLNRQIVDTLVSENDAVIHLAAQPSVPLSIEEPWLSHDVNVNGTVYILEACRKYKSGLVFASSSAVYGPVRELPIKETHATRPQSPYAANKLAAESYALSYAASYDFPVTAYRFFNVYGPLQSPDHAYAAVIPAFVDAALRGRALTIYGDGQQSRDFTYVKSVAEVLANSAIARLSCSTPVNLAFGTRTTIVDLAHLIQEMVDRQQELVFQPSRMGDIRDSQASCSLLKELMPMQADYTLREGLRSTVAWFKALKIDQFA
jgi:UDP-glucose 4-epimerase